MRLVDNWQNGWRWISMQAGFLMIVLNTLAIPADVSALVPPWIAHGINTLLGAAVMFGNLVQQKSLQSDRMKEEDL